MLDGIRRARHDVHMESYIFEADDIGKQFVAGLVGRAKAGVKVRLIYDAVGSNKTPKEFFKDLEAGGVEVVDFNPVAPGTVLKEGPAALNHRDHPKPTIVDGPLAFLRGINISALYGSHGPRSFRPGRGADPPLPNPPR